MAEKASIGGVPFDCETVADGFEKSLAVYEFPYSDTPQVEDLGQKARTVRVKAWFTGARYENHNRLISLFKSRTAIRFNHPKYGELTGYIRTATVNHDDLPDTAVVDFEFVATRGGQPARIKRRDVKRRVETAATAGFAAATENLRSALKDLLAGYPDSLDISLDPALPVAPQIQGLVGAARALVRRISTAVALVEGTLADVTILASSVISTIDFAVNLPGRVIGAFAQVAERYVTALSSIATAPDRLLRSLSASLDDLMGEIFPDGDDGSGVYPAFLASTSLVMALAAANGFDADQEERNNNAALAGAESFDAAGNFLKTESPADVLNVAQIETALALARAPLAAALAADRANRPLADAAAALLAHVSAAKLELENLTTTEVEHETPLFLVLLANGLGYQDADRVLAVNPAIVSPSFTSGEVQIYVR